MTLTYNDRDVIETVTDARQHKLFFTYDDLARKTGEYKDDTVRAYDTAPDSLIENRIWARPPPQDSDHEFRR